MTTTLSISRLINVQVILAPLAAQAQNLSDLLMLGTSNVIDVTERLRTYNTLDEVAADFGTTVDEYKAAVLWFEQAPQPTEIKIGRWAKTATHGKLNGGTLSAAQQLIATWDAVTTPGFNVTLAGIPYAIHPASFAAQTNLNGVASIIQTALTAALASSTCVWNANLGRFEIQTGSTGAASTISFVTPPTAVGFVHWSGQPSDSDKITLGGTDVVFASPAAGGKVTISAVNLAGTLANLLAFLNASVDANIVKFTYSINPANTDLEIVAATPGAGGDALTLARTGASMTVSGATLSGGTATDISGMLAMLAASSGAYTAQGIDAESALAAATVFDNLFGQTWYALTIPAASDADHQLVGPYIEGTTNKHLYGVSTQAAGVISAVSTTDIAYLMKALNLKRSIVQYSSSNAYAVCSLLGRALTVNYGGNNTVITLMYKQEPGITAETLTATQIDALEGKNCNVFVAYNNNTAIIEQGKTCAGDFIDEITGTDWLAVTVQTAVYNLLYTSPTKIPQTDPGMHQLVNAIEAVCSQAVINGLLAPGVWTANGFGTLAAGAFLAKGFYVYAPPVATQLQADREARKSVVIQVAAKLAGAVHTVSVIITVVR